MASITIRNLDKSLKEKLKFRRLKKGRSMEEEVCPILNKSGQPENLADRIHERFAAFGGVSSPNIEREPIRKPINFE